MGPPYLLLVIQGDVNTEEHGWDQKTKAPYLITQPNVLNYNLHINSINIKLKLNPSFSGKAINNNLMYKLY